MRAEEVLQTAVRLFAQRGFAATGIREIGREVGLNSATLYHYVGNKEGLLVTIMRSCLEELLRGAAEAIEPSDDPRVQLGRLIRAHAGLSATNPLTARVTDQEFRALSAHTRGDLLALRDNYESMVSHVIERGRATGQFVLHDSHLARLALLEMCNGIANWYRSDGRLTVPDVQERFVEFGYRLVGLETYPADDLGPEQIPARLVSEPDPPQPAAQEAM